MAQHRLNVQAPIERLFARRWSTRAFADTPVEEDVISSCLEAARWAPSCYGEQPWRFVVANRFTDRDNWQAVLHTLAEANQAWAQAAPVLIVAVALPYFTHNHQPNRWAAYDLGQAVISLCLQATAEGLATHQMGGFDADALRQAVQAPAASQVMSVIALGYATAASAAPESMQAAEVQPRSRKSLHEIAFQGQWAQPWQAAAALGWEARYQESDADSLPWFHDGLDDDIAEALARLERNSGRVLDWGCGPGTQAVALAQSGFDVVASDVAATAIEGARQRAAKAGVNIETYVDDVRNSRLSGPFDVIIDRGVFHCFPEEEDQQAYRQTALRLLADDGLLILKCFHRDETSEQGPPCRYDHQDIIRLLPEFELLDSWSTRFGAACGPLAQLCILRKKDNS